MLKERQDAPERVVYVVAEKEQLALLPEKCVRIYCAAPLNVIKERFSARMHGHMPTPVETMLEKKHGCFDGEAYDLKADTSLESAEEIRRRVETFLKGGAGE